MWFRNLIVLRVPAGSPLDADTLADALLPFAFTEPTSVEALRTGLVPPRDGDASLVASVGRQLLFALRQEKKLLPAKVVAQFVRQRAERIEAEEGFRPGRKRMKEIKEQVVDELLPRAFSLATDTRAWIDPVNGWLVVDAASTSRADEVVGLLAKAFDGFPGRPLKTAQSPAGAMTAWLSDGEAPAGFSIDQDVVLKARDGKATVRYANQSLEADDVGRHVKAGKQCTRLALTWRDRVSIVLTDTLAIKRVRPLDVLTESQAGSAASTDADERFASDFALMTGELAALLDDVVDALGGPLPDGRLEAPAATVDGASPAIRRAA
ncbi:MAG TPA: recombination-associated protein RdgC [Burkholderiaceae bacterium]|nr:recombination-associated protein RdgC [Burkholderiaceae bacterium]